MVVTRSQGDAADLEEQNRVQEQLDNEVRRERLRIERERARRVSLDPPASPSMTRQGEIVPRTEVLVEVDPLIGAAGPSSEPGRGRSPAPSVRSRRSNVSVDTRLRLAELEAAEKMAEIRRRELEIEAELVKKRLAVEISTLQDERDSNQGEPQVMEDHSRVDDWLRANPVDSHSRNEHRVDSRQIRFDEPNRSETPKTPETPRKIKNGIEQLAETLEKMARPRPRHTELPIFSGAVSEWLPFKASMIDTTKMYRITPAENIQRLRNCLKGEAREIVSALLHTATDPEIIMRTLEQCFGRPEVIIDKTLEEIKRMPRPSASAKDLNNFAIKLQNVVCVLKTIDRKGYLYNPMLTREILEKLSPHIRSRWCDYACENEGSTEPEIVMLSNFLMREADRALRFTYTPSSSAASTSTSAAKKEVRPAVLRVVKKPTAVYNVTEEKDKCPCCDKLHVLYQCPKFKALSVEERWNFVRENRICFKCVHKRHRRINCRAKVCGVNQCKRPHHFTLHYETTPEARSSATEAATTRVVETTNNISSENITEVNNGAVLSVTSNKRSVLLKVCPVVIAGPRGEVETHALLDEGATITLIDEDIASSIGAGGPRHSLQLKGVNMSQQENGSKLITIDLRGTEKTHKIRAHTVKNLQLYKQTIPASVKECEHLRNLPSDEICYDNVRPGILIGADNWELIVSRELRIGKKGEPAASRTELGWVIHGSYTKGIARDTNKVFHVYSQPSDIKLHELVENHFAIDSLGIKLKPRENEFDVRAKKIIEETIRQTKTGFEVGLPWRFDNANMPDSYDMAMRRLRSIERKMDMSPEFAANYTKQVENLLMKDYATLCDGSESESPVSWFLPHFGVTNVNKPGKLRLVFDAAARSNNLCLNDFLLEGPDMLTSLPGILFRFRERAVAVTADIQEMFLQVKIRKEDQPAQQFLWRGMDRSSPPTRYKMSSMIFGAASSPFMAHFVRNYNAEQHKSEYPIAFEAITRGHYMDDLVVSYESEQEAQKAIKEIQQVHAEAGFTLRGWSSNQVEVLRDIPMELFSTTTNPLGTRGEGLESKILGLYWSAESDQLGFNTSMNRVPAEVRDGRRAPTKREALSAVMSIYDPLGLLSLYTIRAKIILQNLWRIQMAWDDYIPEEDNELFQSWISQLTEINSLRLNRCYFKEENNIELHVFCDASEQAYAAVAYWRMTNDKNNIKVVLVAAKAKVAPKKVQTIPRLELQAAVIGTRLADTIIREHTYNIDQVTFWTDSSTVCNWIKDSTKRYTPFVAHRLGEIAELSSSEQWRWLPTEHNVADDATRFNRTRIGSDDRWFMGPQFLYRPKDAWPQSNNNSENEYEVLHITETTDCLPDPHRFSNYEKLVRTTARILFFIEKCRRQAATTTLESRHLEDAEKLLISRAQREDFKEDLHRLQNRIPITRGNKTYKLDPILEQGIMKVRGRIGAAEVPMEVKNPVILHGKNKFTELLVMREHCAAGHANRERVINDLRQKYWIVNIRPTVKRIQRMCKICKIRKSSPKVPAMGDLPKERLQPFHRPFSFCGVDYFGPMTVKIGRRHEKRWGALFTCLTTRAIHIELVASLSTDSAILALRRMAARRGWPKTLFSDNATNFRGANAELRAAYEEWLPALRDEGLRHRLAWKFIPPGAPNQGGAWERLVRSVKVALAATLQEKTPSEEVLQTLLAEAEFSINARPLTYVSVNPNDPEALTPNHFLLGSSMGLPSTGPCDESDKRKWRATQALADFFWRRWLREYLPTLVPRRESQKLIRKLKVGDVVTVVDNNLPRNVWPVGVVEKTYEGPDGGVRTAEVRTRTGLFKRPVSKLVVLLEEEGATQAAPGGEM